MIRPHQKQSLWFAHIVHRVSGLALALFLPLHFLVLGQALNGAAAMDRWIQIAELPLVKAAEFVLVFGLAVHLFGGLRLLALEFLPWSDRQKTLAAVAFASGFFIACTFLLQAL